jgi:hypothetical protein
MSRIRHRLGSGWRPPLMIMPFLSRAQRRTGRTLGSNAVVADSTQTLLCTYLSAVLLAGLVLKATVAWAWADPLAGLVIAAGPFHRVLRPGPARARLYSDPLGEAAAGTSQAESFCADDCCARTTIPNPSTTTNLRNGGDHDG